MFVQIRRRIGIILRFSNLFLVLRKEQRVMLALLKKAATTSMRQKLQNLISTESNDAYFIL